MKSCSIFFLLFLFFIFPGVTNLSGDEPGVTKKAGQETKLSGDEWELSFSDGSNNNYHFRLNASFPTGILEYDPIQPQESSSGIYSGGEPKNISVSPEIAQQIRERVTRLAADKKNHTEMRTMGSGDFVLKEPSGESRFLYANGKVLTEFTAFLRGLVENPPGKASEPMNQK